MAGSRPAAMDALKASEFTREGFVPVGMRRSRSFGRVGAGALVQVHEHAAAAGALRACGAHCFLLESFGLLLEVGWCLSDAATRWKPVYATSSVSAAGFQGLLHTAPRRSLVRLGALAAERHAAACRLGSGWLRRAEVLRSPPAAVGALLPAAVAAAGGAAQLCTTPAAPLAPTSAGRWWSRYATSFTSAFGSVRRCVHLRSVLGTRRCRSAAAAAAR